MVFIENNKENRQICPKNIFYSPFDKEQIAGLDENLILSDGTKEKKELDESDLGKVLFLQ